MGSSSLKQFLLGFSYEKNREAYFLWFFSLSYIAIFTLAVLAISFIEGDLLPVSYRYHILALLGVLVLVLVRAGYLILARLILLFIPPFLILILPSLSGMSGPVTDEFYFWFPYVPIAFSIIAHFTCHVKRDRLLLMVTLGFYLLLSLLTDDYLIWMSDGTEEILPLVMKHRFWYSLLPVLIFSFVNIALSVVFSEIYRNENLVRRQQAKLLQTEKMASLGTLTAGIAHEINNPLNFISGGLHATRSILEELLKPEGVSREEKEKLLEQLERIMNSTSQGVSRASDIVSNLAFFASPGTETKKKCNLEQALFPLLMPIEEEKGQDLIMKEIPEGFEIYCYETPLLTVINHVLDNAFHALDENTAEKKGIIRIRAEKIKLEQEPYSRISIFNNGPTIPEENLKKIYDPFFTSREAGKGKGLGMAISYMIIKEHGGNIEAHNTGEGVEFSISLPESLSS